MSAQRTLIAGIGNVFMGDDGFGVEVAQRLARRSWPEGVRVMDAGIRGIDLTYALIDGYDRAILIDAAQRGREPGTLYVIEPEPGPDQQLTLLDAHALDPVKVLAYVRSVGSPLSELRVVACEPEQLGSFDEPCMQLSDVVRAAIDPACELVQSLVAEWSVAHA
ncbi:MAG TPA: hydrogenase maturation protease [Polyangiales bacterium]|jgi:hydrogenase maturation protease|nr:hydrogenase maturation protease [Polyangiales bacterium]